MKQTAENRCFDGRQLRYRHYADSLNCEMDFSIYLPPLAETSSVPVLYWLSGLTCTDQNFVTKAGAQQYAAACGIAIVTPDTSPRGEHIADDPERYDLGKGAGFYVNATQAPWSKHYHMYDYVTRELPELIEKNFPIVPGLRSISGHSMGGHGALVCTLKNPGVYRSVSAFAPICNPGICTWGQGCLGAYLGADRDAWKEYDATELLRGGAVCLPLFIDQGAADEFLSDQLHPDKLETVCRERNIDLRLRMHEGYDHSYYFIATFIGEHISYHARLISG
jgi:S-formylglutathione hydrolase